MDPRSTQRRMVPYRFLCYLPNPHFGYVRGWDLEVGHRNGLWLSIPAEGAANTRAVEWSDMKYTFEHLGEGFI